MHDRVVARVAKRWKNSYKVWTNPGSQKNYSFRGVYPDVIAKDFNYVSHIAEIETADSVRWSELEQWIEYANLGRPFYLFVPEEKAEEAVDLLLQGRIKSKTRLWIWWEDGRKIKLMKYG